MEINPISGGETLGKTLLSPVKTGAADVAQEKSFKELLSSALKSVDTLQGNADEAVRSLAAGDPIDLHTVMMSMEEASMALQLTMQIRNKLVDAYQEIMRMQV